MIMQGKEWQAWAKTLSMQGLIECKDALSSLHPKIKEEFEGLDTVQGILQLEYRVRIKKKDGEDYE